MEVQNQQVVAVYLDRLLKAREESTAQEQERQRLEVEYRRLKEQKRDAMNQYQEEIYELDRQEAEKTAEVKQTISRLEEGVEIERREIIRQITLCSVKHALSESSPCEDTDIPEDSHIIYENNFLVLYERLHPNEKPVNCISYQICQEHKCSNEIRYILEKLEKALDIHSWHDEPAIYFDRDFKNEGDAQKYADRNRDRVTANYIETIQSLEQEIENAADDMDTVFDFRVVISPQIETVRAHYSRSQQYGLVGATRHTLTVEREHAHIVIIQDQHEFKVDGNRHEDDTGQLLDFVTHYFQLVKGE